MTKPDVTFIPAIVQLASPERTEYKPYRTELTFGGKVTVEIPVPTEHVRKEKDQFILTLKGWTIFLDTYATMIEAMDEQYKSHLRTGIAHKPF